MYCLVALSGPVPHAQAVGLVVGAVRARDDLLVCVRTWKPRLEVVLPRRHRAHVAGADVNHPVVQPETVPQIHSVTQQFLVMVP